MQALSASDEEIASTVDMSDLPLSLEPPRSPRGTPLAAARALFGLRGEAGPLGPAGAAPAAPRSPLGLLRGQPAEEEAAPPTPAVADHSVSAFYSEAPAGDQEAPDCGASLASRLTCLLGRLLTAAGTSGSSIADLAAAGSGALVLASGVGSSCSSLESLASARSGGGSACSSDSDLYCSADEDEGSYEIKMEAAGLPEGPGYTEG